jgi:hypothetical protein
LPDEFLGAGALPTLHDLYGISTDAVVRTIKSWLTKDTGKSLKQQASSRA